MTATSGLDWIRVWCQRPELPGVQPWRLRWCGNCRRWEVDAGPPEGWIAVQLGEREP